MKVSFATIVSYIIIFIGLVLGLVLEMNHVLGSILITTGIALYLSTNKGKGKLEKGDLVLGIIAILIALVLVYLASWTYVFVALIFLYYVLKGERK